MSQDKDKLALFDMDIDILERNVLVVVRLIGFINVFKFDHSGFSCRRAALAVMVTVIHIIEYHDCRARSSDRK